MKRKSVGLARAGVYLPALVLLFGSGLPIEARADEAYAKSMLKSMSDYLAAQQTISFGYDINVEIVTIDHQKLLFAGSGTVNLNRPDKIHATRDSGFASVEMIFDGKTLTLLDKNANLYGQVEMPGSVDHLVDEMRDKLNRPFPGADLLMSDVYDVLMADVVDVKDLGSGVIGGTECDHLAFRNEEVDWQIWIAHGESPYPCRYVITSTKVDQGPQYSVQVKDWKTGSEVAAEDFSFKNTANATKIDATELKDTDDVPTQYSPKGDQ